jgi:hypothetical protein
MRRTYQSIRERIIEENRESKYISESRTRRKTHHHQPLEKTMTLRGYDMRLSK